MGLQKSKDVFFGLEISDSFVRCLAGKKQKDGTISALTTGESELPFSAVKNGQILDIPAVTTACESSISAAEESSGFKCTSAVFGLSGELIKSYTLSVHYHRNISSSPITDEEISSIVKKTESRARKSAESEIRFELNNPDMKISLLESVISSLLIDGQRLSNPIGFTGEDITLELYTVFAPESIISPLEKICEDLEIKLLSIANAPFALCRACLDGADFTPTPMILLSIDSFTTTVSVIDTIGIRGTASFNRGTKSIEKSLPVWSDCLNIAFSNFSHVDILPSRIYLCGTGADNTALSEHLALSDWYVSLPFARRPLINLLEMDNCQKDFAVSMGLAIIASESAPEDTSLLSKIKNLLKK